MSHQNHQAPVASARPRRTTVFGHELLDDYYWLRERENPEVIAHLKAENAYTEAVLEHTASLQHELFTELVGYVKDADQSAPAPRGPYRYYERTEAGKQYKIHCRTYGDDGPEEILLDENLLARDLEYFRLGALKISPDQRLLAYTSDTNGSERFNLFVKDLEAGRIIDGPIPDVTYDLQWADDKTLIYAVCDEAWRTYKLLRHIIGSAPEHDALVYHEADESFWLHLSKTRSGAFLVLHSKSNTTSELLVLPTDDPRGEFRLIFPRRSAIEMYLDHSGDYFYLNTNESATNFKVVRVPVAQPSAPPEEIIAHNPAIHVAWIELFDNHMVVAEREGGLEHLQIVDLATRERHRIGLPEPVYAIEGSPPHANADFATTTFRFAYSSPVTPLRTYDYNMAQHTLTLVKQLEVPNYEPEGFRAERVYAAAPDGVLVPVTLITPVDLPRDGGQPLYLNAYGSYGSTSDPTFDIRRLPLLQRGISCAIAHIRGGGELGRTWYEDGKVLTKRNSFTDFIASAEHLIAQGYTRPERLVIKGRSAGGLLMGAVVTMRPDLFRAVIAGVPFVDVINTSLDPSIPLVINEYEEWGDPRIPEQFEYMLSYSPYDNTTPQDYPTILATAGLYDPRVQYWEPAKWVAKLRTVTTGTAPILLKTEMVGGHSGPTGRFNYLKDIAFEYAFFLNALGMLEQEA